MSNAKDVLDKQIKIQRYKKIAHDLSILVEQKAVSFIMKSLIDDYEIIRDVEQDFQGYRLYKEKNTEVFALIQPTIMNQEKKFKIYELDYSDEETINELMRLMNISYNRSNQKIAHALNVFAWVMIVIGILMSSLAFEESPIVGISFIFSASLSGVLIMALSKIVVYLGDMSDTLKDMYEDKKNPLD